MRSSLRTPVAFLRPRVALAMVLAGVVLGGLACDTQRVVESVERAIAAVRLTPGAALLRVGTRVPLAATPVDALGVAVPNVTITWAVADTTVARVTPAGELWGRAPGHTTVRATALSGTTEISTTAPVDVTLVPVATVTVTPAPATVVAGSVVQLVALAADSAGQPLVGRAATWASNNGAAATVSQAGVVTGVAAGQATITAVVEGRTGTSVVTVNPPPAPPPVVQQIVLTPASVTLATGATQQFTATAQMSNGTQQPAAVTYTATGGTISGAGLYTAGSSGGSYRVIATQQGGTLADTAAVTVTAPPPPPPVVVTRMDVTPATVTLATAATRQFAATEFLSDGSSRAATGVTWTATGGTISGTGLYTAGSSGGSYRVIGTKGTFADTAAVTITAPPPPPVVTQIILTPASVTLVTGATQQFTATAQMSNGTQQPAVVTWTATGGTVTPVGLYTAGLTAGTSYRVIATEQGGTLADTAAITLTVPPPPPPPGGSLAWFEDFRLSLTDKGMTHIWNNAPINRLAKSSATGSWPSELTHVAENVYVAQQNGAYQVDAGELPAVAVGQYLFARMLVNNSLPSGANTGGDHGFQTNVGTIAWFWRIWGGGASSFSIEFSTWDALNGNNMLQVDAPKDVVLRMEWRAHRTTSTTATLSARVYNNQTGALLREVTGLAQSGVTATHFREFIFGMSGQGGATFNGGSVYWGALAFRVSNTSSDWIGAYPVAGVER